MKSKITFIIALLIFGLFFINDAQAQCAMCGAVAESSMKDGGGAGRGLNSGILYMMAIPYVLFMIVVWVFFRKQISAKIQSFRLGK